MKSKLGQKSMMRKRFNEWLVAWVDNRVTGLVFTYSLAFPGMRDRIVEAADRGVTAARQLATSAGSASTSRATQRRRQSLVLCTST